jgi:hypothetical protein
MLTENQSMLTENQSMLTENMVLTIIGLEWAIGQVSSDGCRLPAEAARG